jgi:hypothetical protein
MANHKEAFQAYSALSLDINTFASVTPTLVPITPLFIMS